MELSTWFIDVIFNKFTVSKKQGTLVIRKNFWYSNYFDSIRERYSTLDIKKVLFLAKEWEDPEKLEALEYLWLTGHKKCKKLAVKALNDEYAWVAAVFILWEIGDIWDISSLRKKALRLEKYEMPWLLHINDALEKIFYRS